MNIKSILKQIPFLVPVYRHLKGASAAGSENKTFNQLAKSRYPQGEHLKNALESLQRELDSADRQWQEKIEAERNDLLNRDEPLVDGSLGDGGLYDADVTVQQACSVSKPFKPALLLYLLTRALQPKNVIELGTNVGISSAYIGAALKANGQSGRITTLEASPYRLRLAKEIHRNIGIDNVSYVNGLFVDTLTPTLADLPPVDLAFIDGHHQYQPTLDYFESIFAHSTPDAVFVFDDIRWSDGMLKAWSELQADQKLGLIVDLDSVGIGVRSQPAISRRYIFGPINAF